MCTIRDMVSDFCCQHSLDWSEVRKKDEYKYLGTDGLCLQSYIGTDLMIDLIYLVRDVEEGPFTEEIWIRSMGTVCVRNEKDAETARCWRDIVAKISITYDGKEFTDIHWVEDKDCLVKNKFLK